MHYNCLIVDDEVELTKMTAEYFEMFGVSSFVANDRDSCLGFLAENTCDIVLLDVNLGDQSGFELCKKIREDSDMPILFISARQSDDDVLIALNIGGDDYVKKPYTLSVLLAKVKVILRRNTSLAQGTSDVVTKTESSPIDRATMSVTIDGQKIQLKAREFALMEYLYEHRNTIVTKNEIFEAVWGDSFYSDGTLNVHIRRLREKIEQDPNNPRYIKTIWGTGYMLEM
ncbi:DNA-binding response regulator, OmpR family, contains REC and winged-helix (wHTH) domain [Ruminococcaceae bacterium YRB3002]|nr:DNA-binding response regulator, OmpR family, contains REC and winged-helix (wHTH) domain [Ruminococcaceae bacterium YRB3002]